MVDTLKWVITILALVAVLVAVGLGIERSRRRHLLAFAREHGGTFEPGTLMQGAPVPEAAPFDAPIVISSGGDDGGDPPKPSNDITYRNVVRIRGDEASYVVTHRSEGHSDAKGERDSTSQLVCLITLAASDLPPIDVTLPMSDGDFEWMFKEWGALKPVKLALADPTPRFTKEFEVRTAPGAAKPPPEALDLVLDRAVQAELLAHRSLISGLEVRGNAVRLLGVTRPGNDAYPELYELARRLAKIWAAKGRR